MDKELLELLTPIFGDFACAEKDIETVNELIPYLHMKSRFFDELELINSLLKDCSNILRYFHLLEDHHNKQSMKALILAIRQARMMASDLLQLCRKNMCLA